MTIKEWFEKGCDYKSGVDLYEKYGRNKILLRRFRRLNSPAIYSKLKYELSKLISEKPQQFVFNENKVTNTVELRVSKSVDVIKKSIKVREMTVKPISAYPVELHEVYKKRVESFYSAASLKQQLNDLSEDQEEESLAIQLEIWRLIKQNEKCWRLLKHYDKTKQILPDKSDVDYSGLTPQELVNQRQRLYVNQSRRAITLKKKKLEYDQELNPARKLRIEDFILRKTEELQIIENNIEKLSDLINE